MVMSMQSMARPLLEAIPAPEQGPGNKRPCRRRAVGGTGVLERFRKIRAWAGQSNANTARVYSQAIASNLDSQIRRRPQRALR